MFTVKSVCELQHNALEINVGDQVERLDQLVHGANGEDYFARTFITDGMKTLLTKGIARLAESRRRRLSPQGRWEEERRIYSRLRSSCQRPGAQKSEDGSILPSRLV